MNTGLVIGFTADGCWVASDAGEVYAKAGIAGTMTNERRSRIAEMLTKLVAECQDGEVIYAPFGDGALS